MRIRWCAVGVIAVACTALAAAPAGAEEPVDPPEPRQTVGVETAAFPPIGASWLDTVTRYRLQSGLPPVTDEPSWAAGQLEHIDYLANTERVLRTGTYASAHTENPQSPWFTRDGAVAAASSNITIGTSLSERGIV